MWIPVNANLEKVECNINKWMKQTTEYPYSYKIQDRINSMYPTMGVQRILYIVKINDGVLKIPYQHIPKKKCTICLEEDNECFDTLVCGHEFHLKCINRWFKINNTCPLCRLFIRYTLLVLETLLLGLYQLTYLFQLTYLLQIFLLTNCNDYCQCNTIQ